MVRVLDPDGNLVGEPPDLDDARLLEFYRWMVFARIFDERCLNLQRQGRMGTYAPLAGQEAAQVGSAFALEPDDWVFPSYREHAVTMIHGLPMENVLLYWMGREEGNRIPEHVNVFTVAVPIATQIPHAVGAAWAAKIRGDRRAFIVYFGDGATSEGDFHEGCNFAGVFKAPVVFFCQNNQFAISVPLHRQTASETIAQKAVAYGFPGVRVDGNDVLAVYKVTREALDRARAGEGPTLIEAVTYRFGPHTTADDPTRYRTPEEVEEWRERRDPITRMRRFLMAKGLLDEAQDRAIAEEARERIAAAVRAVEQMPKAAPESIFDYVYAQLPWHLEEQRRELLEELGRTGGTSGGGTGGGGTGGGGSGGGTGSGAGAAPTGRAGSSGTNAAGAPEGGAGSTRGGRAGGPAGAAGTAAGGDPGRPRAGGGAGGAGASGDARGGGW